MKKVAEINIKADKSVDAKEFVSKVKEIVNDLNEDIIEENDYQNDLSDVVINMYEKNYSLKEIVEITNLSISEIASIIEDFD
jgi:flagellar hook-basal body complex protein FliE